MMQSLAYCRVAEDATNFRFFIISSCLLTARRRPHHESIVFEFAGSGLRFGNRLAGREALHDMAEAGS
jgi:hypothetical protein